MAKTPEVFSLSKVKAVTKRIRLVKECDGECCGGWYEC